MRKKPAIPPICFIFFLGPQRLYFPDLHWSYYSYVTKFQQRNVSKVMCITSWPGPLSLSHGTICSYPFFLLEESMHGEHGAKFWRAGATKWKKARTLNVAWRRVRQQSGTCVLDSKRTRDTLLSTLCHYMCWSCFVIAARVTLTDTYLNWADLSIAPGFSTYFSLKFSIIYILKIIQCLNKVQLPSSSSIPFPSATVISLSLNFL